MNLDKMFNIDCPKMREKLNCDFYIDYTIFLF